MTSILLVEDHGATRQSIGRALLDAGFEVHLARDGASALELMTKQRPEIVIQDLVLPDIDGFALARKLRTLADDAPLRMIAFSGLVSNGDARKIAELGFDDVIAKPVLPSRLVQLVRAQCDAETHARNLALRTLHELSDPLAARVVSPLASNSQEVEGELLRRCSALSAELVVTRAISHAVLQGDDVEGALVNALSTCFDAGQCAFGALYLHEGEQLRTRALGSERNLAVSALVGFFGHEAWLRAVIETGRAHTLADANEELRMLLRRAGVRAAIVLPLIHHGSALGALFMVSPSDAHDPAFEHFAHGIADQIAHALALADAFRRREHAEREAEQQRRLARDQAAIWRALVDGAPDTVMHLDARGTLRFINHLPAQVESASSWFEMVDAEHHAAMRSALASVFRDGAAHELELAAGDVFYACHIGPIRSGGEVTGAMVIQRDVSEKKRAESQLIVADRMASVGSLAAAIAHEVNNPLASVLANLELALREAKELAMPGELLDELKDAREAATRVRSIVRDLYVFSHADDGSVGPVDVERVLDSALRMAWNEVRQRASLQRDFQVTPRVWGNESRLGQALLGLLLHAAHGIEEGHAEQHTIVVQLFADAYGRVVITVHDRGTASVCERPASDALGLSICQRVVNEYKGTLSFGSDGQNELCVIFPACAEPAVELGSDRNSEIRALRRGRVLVIDDERLITQVVRRTLTREHDVVTLDNAVEALRRLEAGERYDAIVCDLMMPRLSGMEFHRRVLRDFPDLADKIVFFTGGAFTPKAREFLRNVPNQRVDKPVAGDELRAVINGIVR
jgi:CheY-like chemotaxis protein